METIVPAALEGGEWKRVMCKTQWEQGVVYRAGVT